MIPETGQPTLGRSLPRSPASGAMDAVVTGTAEGLKLFWSIVASLIVFVALVKLADIGLSALPDMAGAPVTLERLLGLALAPVAWLLGIPWAEASTAGALLGTKNRVKRIHCLHRYGQTAAGSPFGPYPADFDLCHVQLRQLRQCGHPAGRAGHIVPGAAQ